MRTKSVRFFTSCPPSLLSYHQCKTIPHQTGLHLCAELIHRTHAISKHQDKDDLAYSPTLLLVLEKKMDLFLLG